MMRVKLCLVALLLPCGCGLWEQAAPTVVPQGLQLIATVLERHIRNAEGLDDVHAVDCDPLEIETDDKGGSGIRLDCVFWLPPPGGAR